MDDDAGERSPVSLDSPPVDASPTAPPLRPATDWERYGHRPAVPPARSSAIQPDGGVARRARVEPREDLYADYRREGRSSGLWRAKKPSKARANAVGLAIVIGVAAMFVVAGIVATENNKPKPTPSPTATPSATATASAAPSLAPATIPPILGPLAMVADLPSGVDAPDRSMPQEDGQMLYLGGALDGVQVNTQTAELSVRTAGYGASIGRQVVAGGNVWRGTSWEPATICGPACWAKSTTYRIDAATGKIQKTYAATYLVGYDANAVWIAGSKGVQKLDPGTASVLATIPWKSDAEPRVGCGGVWSANNSNGGTTLGKVNVTTGAAAATASNFDSFSYGPVQVHGHCWVISNGVRGVALQPMSIGLLGTTDGLISSTVQPEWPVVILDGEFWAYESGGKLQRYDPLIGRYGRPIELGVVPVIDNPLALFSSMHKLWAIDGPRLIGYDVTTGSAGTGS